MVEIIIFHHPTSQIHHHHLPLLTLCGKRVKQSQTVRSGRFESNLLTWSGRPNTRMGTESPTRLFPFLSGLWIRVTHLDYKNPLPACAFLYPHVAACEPSSKRVKVKSTRRADQVLKLTDYHISRHVVGTFKCLTTTTTHCGLIHFH